MKRLILFLFLLNSLFLFAQSEWAPIGAKWYFNQPSSESNNFVVFESIKDSAIDGNHVRIIDVKLNGADLISKEYLMQNKDSIFYYNTNSKTFNLLYNLAAKAGDTIIVHKGKFKPTKVFFSDYDSIENFKYKVVAIDSILISGEWVKRQKIENLKNNQWGFTKPKGVDNDYILDKVGSITYFFGVSPNTFPEEKFSIIRCYSETGFYYKNPLWDQECGIIDGLPDNLLFADDCHLYPNPFNNLLCISVPEPIIITEIYNANGQKIAFTNQGNEKCWLNTSSIMPGFYIIKLKTKNAIYIKKIVKN